MRRRLERRAVHHRVVQTSRDGGVVFEGRDVLQLFILFLQQTGSLELYRCKLLSVDALEQHRVLDLMKDFILQTGREVPAFFGLVRDTRQSESVTGLKLQLYLLVLVRCS